MKRSKSLAGAAVFEAYYAGLFGSRWEPLKQALLAETEPAAFSVCGEKPYYLDRASIAAAQALPLLEEGRCLDMCAAPGGKTLVLASGMGAEVYLQANELSRTRRTRLINVIGEHLPAAISARVEVTGFDAAILPRFEQNLYDRILLDAPCSSERHVLTDPKYLAVWTPARIKALAQRQWALLSAAFLVLKPGGFLVYATCALTDAENDGVVARLLKKYKQDVRIHQYGTPPTGTEIHFLHDTAANNKLGFASSVAAAVSTADISSSSSISNAGICTAEHIPVIADGSIAFYGSAAQLPPLPYEQTEYGCRFLPDVCGGAGPLYFSLIEKRASTD